MDKNWKRFERHISKLMGSKRALNHLAGGGDMTDVDHPVFSVDCKLRKTFSLSDFDKLRLNARKHNKIPVLVYRKPKERRTYAIMDFETFRSLARGAGWIDTDVDVKSDADGVQVEAGGYEKNCPEHCKNHKGSLSTCWIRSCAFHSSPPK